MIRDVYVLRRTGEVLVHKAFSGGGVDETIFSGFYSALSTFAEELGHGGIETIRMGDVSFYYQHADDLLFAIAADKSHDPQEVQNILSDLRQRFLSRYRETLASWSGDTKIFNPFLREVERIIAESRVAAITGPLVMFPFALDGSQLKDKGLDHPELDATSLLVDLSQELAAVFLLAEEARLSDRRFLPPGEGGYQFLARLLWPLWAVRTPDGHLLLLDGLQLVRPAATQGYIPPTTRFQALLKVDSSQEYLQVLGKLEEEVRGAAQPTPISGPVIPAELTKLLSSLSRFIGRGDKAASLSVPLPSRITEQQARKAAKAFYAQAVESHAEAAEQWSQFLRFFEEDLERWASRIQQEEANLHKYYQSRLAKVKEEVERELTKLAQREEAERAKVDKWRLKEEGKLAEELKENLKAITQALEVERRGLSELLDVDTAHGFPLEKFVAPMLERLEELSSFTSELRRRIKEAKSRIQQARKASAELAKEAKRREDALSLQFQEREREQRARIAALERERQDKIEETRQRLEAIGRRATQIRSLIQQLIATCKEQLRAGQGHLVEEGALPVQEEVAQIYIPIYVVGLQQEDGSTKLLAIPPLQVPPRKPPSRLLGQRGTPAAALASSLAAQLKAHLEEAWSRDSKMAEMLRRAASKRNLLHDPQTETLIYTGLHALWKSRLIPEKTHTQVKLACIDAYRFAAQ